MSDLSGEAELLHMEYRASLVLLACAVAFIGTHAAVSLCEQFRLALSFSVSGWSKYGVLALVALSLGGVGFSCTQYVVFASIRLRTSDNSIVYLQFNPAFIVGSIFVGAFVTFIALYIASTDECFNKSKKEIMEIFIRRTSQTRSIGEIKHMGKLRILFIVCTSSLHRIIASGIVFGGALSLARYMGVQAIQFNGTVHFDKAMIALSVVLSMLVCTVGSWLFFRVLSVFPSMDIFRTACSIVGVVGITGVHYVRLVGVEFHYDPAVPVPDSSVPYTRVIVVVLTCAVVFSFVMLAFVLSDLRSWLLRTSAQLRPADRALVAMLNRQKSIERVAPTDSPFASPLVSPGRNGSHDVRKFTQVPLEVVNYTRLYLRPARIDTGTATATGTDSPLSPSQSLMRPSLMAFALSPAIYYDVDHETVDMFDGAHRHHHPDSSKKSSPVAAESQPGIAMAGSAKPPASTASRHNSHSSQVHPLDCTPVPTEGELELQQLPV